MDYHNITSSTKGQFGLEMLTLMYFTHNFTNLLPESEKGLKSATFCVLWYMIGWYLRRNYTPEQRHGYDLNYDAS